MEKGNSSLSDLTSVVTRNSRSDRFDTTYGSLAFLHVKIRYCQLSRKFLKKENKKEIAKLILFRSEESSPAIINDPFLVANLWEKSINGVKKNQSFYRPQNMFVA